jgi:hypothetical protein
VQNRALDLSLSNCVLTLNVLLFTSVLSAEQRISVVCEAETTQLINCFAKTCGAMARGKEARMLCGVQRAPGVVLLLSLYMDH